MIASGIKNVDEEWIIEIVHPVHIELLVELPTVYLNTLLENHHC